MTFEDMSVRSLHDAKCIERQDSAASYRADSLILSLSWRIHASQSAHLSVHHRSLAIFAQSAVYQ